MTSAEIERATLELAQRWCDRTLADAEFARLESLLAEHAAARRVFSELAQLQGELRWNFAAPATSVATAPLGESLATPRWAESRWRRSLRYVSQPAVLSLTIAGLFVTAGLLAMALWTLRPGDEAELLPPASLLYVAQVRQTHGAVWSEDSLSERQSPIDLQHDKPLELRAGLIEVRFDSGAVALLEAPVRFTPRGKNRLALQQGKIIARVPPRAVGFTVETPGLTVVDLGTEFGVQVGGAGEQRVDVFQGEVEVSYLEPHDNKTRRTRVVAGGAVEFSVGAIRSKQANRDEWVVELPRKKAYIAYRNLRGAPGKQDSIAARGLDFVVERAIVVHELGVFDSGADGLKRPLTAELWLRDTHGTPDDVSDDRGVEILATLQFTPEQPGALRDSSRFKPLPSPLPLPPGAYSIVVRGYGPQEPNGSPNHGPPKRFRETSTGDGAIRFEGAGRYAGEPGELPPKIAEGPANRYSAGTFLFEVFPSPAVGLPDEPTAADAR